MSHWITMHPDFGIDYLAPDFGIDQSASSSTKQQSDETLRDIKAIAELEPSGIVHIAVLFSFSNCKFYTFWRCPLTRISASCTKNAYSQAKFKSTQIHLSIQIAIVFLFLFCLAKNVQCSFFIFFICNFICCSNNCCYVELWLSH